jgi:hypothetical protein
MNIFIQYKLSRRRLYIKPSTVLMFTDFFSENCLLWDNVEKYNLAKQGTNVKIIRQFFFTCYLHMAIDTYSEYEIFSLLLQKLLRSLTTKLGIYIHCLHNFAFFFANRAVDLHYPLNNLIPHAKYKLIILTDMFR